MSKKPVVLMVLDGYGISDKTEGNASHWQLHLLWISLRLNILM